MSFLKSSVGRKMVMSVTGLVMIFFVLAHLIGNSTIYTGWLNDYAEHLHSLPPLVWMFRLVMLVVLSAHVFFGIQLAIENSAAGHQAYAVRKNLRTTFASRNMIWTGLLIGAFLVYHLLHFTVQVTNPEISASRNSDALGRPDVFMMVLLSFQRYLISSIYIFAMVVLGLHLSHGIQSLIQTFGLNSDATLTFFVKFGMVAALIFFLAYVSIPLTVVAGILQR